MNVEKKEAWDKVTGSAKYTADNYPANMLFARIVTSTIAHGKINILHLEDLCTSHIHFVSKELLMN